MKPTLSSPSTRFITVLALIAAAPMLLAASPAMRLDLAKSDPTDGSTVPAVSEVRLWFNDAPMDMGRSSVTIRILGADGKPIATGNAVRDANDVKVYVVPLRNGLEPAKYTFEWQAMGTDNSAARGRFSFTVAGH